LDNDLLSQDQIDALFKSGAQPASGGEDLTAVDKDVLGEIGNISFGTAATTLSMLLGQRVTITTPQVVYVPASELNKDFPTPHVIVCVEYTKGLEGTNILAIRHEDARVIADLMLGGDGSDPVDELNELHISAIAEAMNQMMGTASTSMSTLLRRPVHITPPKLYVLDEKDAPQQMLMPKSDMLVKISFRLTVGDLVDSRIMQVCSLPFAAAVVGMATARSETETVLSPQEGRLRSSKSPLDETGPSRGGTMTGAADGRSHPDRTDAQGHTVERAEFAAFENGPVLQESRNLDFLLDVPLGLTVELGRSRKLIKEILELSKGSIVELDTIAGEPVDILVNDKLIARGEVVVIDENFGVRVTDIVSPAERLRRLR
jgi:flagellar motor switch protein FliN/FliY